MEEITLREGAARSPGLTGRLGRVAAGLYRLGVALRLGVYQRGWLPVRRLPLKVISIGNLVVGGTGKTPHVALIAEYFSHRGKKVAILSRGYRGKKSGPGAVISTPERIIGTVEEGGEEPYWLAEHLPGVPGPDRQEPLSVGSAGPGTVPIGSDHPG